MRTRNEFQEPNGFRAARSQGTAGSEHALAGPAPGTHGREDVVLRAGCEVLELREVPRHPDREGLLRREKDAALAQTALHDA